MFTSFLHHWLVVTGTMEFDDFPYTGNSNPNWRTHIFQRGRYTTNQIFYRGIKKKTMIGLLKNLLRFSPMIFISVNAQALEIGDFRAMLD